MSTADGSGGSDVSGGEMKLPQLKRSRGAHRGVFTRQATAIRQAGGPLEDVQATLEFLIDRRKMLTELDSQIQQLIEDDDELVADVEEAADVFMAAERGVCLLAMGSRILAKVLTKRLRTWSEKLKILDENQSGFRGGRSTADATQLLVRITEDADDLRKRRTYLKLPEDDPSDPEARLLDLSKAYPRVSKPALWAILRNYGMKGPFLDSLVDLHEATKYQVKGRDGGSEEWIPERGLREGCSTSPCLFNIYHQIVMRIAEKERKMISDSNHGTTGVKWHWVPGSNIPDPNKVEK